MTDEILIYFLIGFLSQMIDGAFGMAYGIMTSSLLMAIFPDTIIPSIASAVVHFSEIFNTGYASYVYKKNKMVNKKMYQAMLYPAIVGSIVGSILISLISKHYVQYVKPMIAIYFVVVGIIIFFRAFHLFEKRKRWMSIPVLSAFAAFMDSIGGGGWGALVTSALIAGGRDMRATIGTAHSIKFVVVIISSLTFLTMLGMQYLWIVMWVSFGSIIAVPLSIRLNNQLPKKWGLTAIATILIFIAIKIIIQSIYFLLK